MHDEGCFFLPLNQGSEANQLPESGNSGLHVRGQTEKKICAVH